MVSPTTALCFHIGEGLNKDSFVLIMHIVTGLRVSAGWPGIA